jgi:predicted nucleotidyltransferase component of viral defense system
LIARVAGALGVDESFVEKDWFVVQAISRLLAARTGELAPVFSGGTSLLKGHRLISRFSEDMDFKLQLSQEFSALSGNQRRQLLSRFRDDVVHLWGLAGFYVAHVESRNDNAFLRIELEYPTQFPEHLALRPHIQAEISARSPRLPSVPKPIGSFVTEFRREAPELARVDCVDPAETAADKLSALAWRVITRDRSAANDDPTVVRHVYDLAALGPLAEAAPGFVPLVAEVMAEDGARGGGAAAQFGPARRVQEMLDRLRDDPLYRVEYQQFAEGMTFAGEGETLTFDAALESVQALSKLVE